MSVWPSPDNPGFLMSDEGFFITERTPTRPLPAQSVGPTTPAEWQRLSWIASDLTGFLAGAFTGWNVGRPHDMTAEQMAEVVVWWLGTNGPREALADARRFYDRPDVPDA